MIRSLDPVFASLKSQIAILISVQRELGLADSDWLNYIWHQIMKKIITVKNIIVRWIETPMFIKIHLFIHSQRFIDLLLLRPILESWKYSEKYSWQDLELMLINKINKQTKTTSDGGILLKNKLWQSDMEDGLVEVGLL